jgi:dihydroorotate dehydrogenase
MTQPLYDYTESYDENRKGPHLAPPPAPDEVFFADVERTLLGLPVGYPIGVPASPLTANSTWIATCASQGFNVLTYKTVRRSPTEALPPPNWIFLEGLEKPLSCEHDLQVARGNASLRPRDPRAYSMANSFGIPSPSPAEWAPDIARARKILRAGQLLIVSVVGEYEELTGQALVEDFVEVAVMAEAAGAPAIELNLSCPNTFDEGGFGARRPICETPDFAREIVTAVRAGLAPETKLVAKLSYLHRDALESVVGGFAHAVDAVAGINTLQIRVEHGDGGPAFRGTRTDPSRGRTVAGLSGVAIRDLALDFVRSLAFLRRTKDWEFDIIGMGGVMEPHDVRALMASGADAVQTATAATNNFELPRQLWSDGYPEPSAQDRLLALVSAALADSRWDFRTVDGIARDLRVSTEAVGRLMRAHPDIARRSAMTGRDGRALYTSPTKPVSLRERLERVRWLLAR